MAETSQGIWMNSYYYLIVVGIAGSVASNRLFRKQGAVKNEDVTVANVTKALTPVGVVFWWLSLAVLVAGVALSFFSSGGGSSAHNLYDAFKRENPDSSDVRMKYLDGKVLKECDLGEDQTLEFGWAKIRQVVSTGDMTSAPSDYKIYILTEHFHGNLTTVKFLGRDEVQPMLDYGAMKGCALQLDSE